MVQKAIKQVSVTKVVDGYGFDKTDALAIEEPLEIRLEFGAARFKTYR
jgi:FdhD protein